MVSESGLNCLHGNVPPGSTGRANPGLNAILRGIDIEIHHRGQAYAHLRALGLEPPPFRGSS